MKVISHIFIVLLFFGCSNIDKQTPIPPLINLVVQQDKYSIIFKHHFEKHFKNYDKNLAKINVKINLSFNAVNAFSNKENNNLSIINGILDFEIFNSSNTEIIKSGSISSSINIGNVSSLYGVDENNNSAKERISKYLAYKLYRKILLNLKDSEN